MADKLTGKAFAELLRKAREYGIVELEIPGVLRFKRENIAAKAPPGPAPPGDGVDFEAASNDSGPPDFDDDEPDPRFLLERIAEANRKPRAS